MPLTHLISRFNELETELKEAVRVNDEQRIRDIDAQIELCFAQVLDYEPADAFERQEKCIFLIERLCPADSRQGIDQLICDKILALVTLDENVKLRNATAK